MTLLPALLLALPACGYRQLKEDMIDLQYRVVVLEDALRAAGAQMPPTLAEQRAAAALYEAYGDHMAAFQIDEAGAALMELLSRFPGTDAAAQAEQRLLIEFAVVGQPAPTLEPDRWLVGGPEDGGPGVDGEHGVTVLLFWETWCPYCRQELPRVEAALEEHADAGISVLSLTRLTQGTTEEDVAAAVEEHGLSYPVGWDEGRLHDYFSVAGIPAAAVVEDGRVTWRGHPGRLDWDVLAARARGEVEGSEAPEIPAAE